MAINGPALMTTRTRCGLTAAEFAARASITMTALARLELSNDPIPDYLHPHVHALTDEYRAVTAYLADARNHPGVTPDHPVTLYPAYVRPPGNHDPHVWNAAAMQYALDHDTEVTWYAP